MPKLPVFGQKKLKKALKALGARIDSSRGSGKHELAIPARGSSSKNKFRNITIPGQKEYGDKGFRKELIRQVSLSNRIFGRGCYQGNNHW